jgi:CRISPR-associated protein Cmr2
MSYDLYVELGGHSQNDVKAVVNGAHRNHIIPDIATRIQLLAGIAAANEGVKDYTVSGDRREGGGYKSLVHKKDQPTPYAKELIDHRLEMMENMGLSPAAPDLSHLPPGSWFLTFTFTLAKPWISKDDDPFYVAESVNPVRKDKVFKVPLMAPSSWKGLLRWTVMHTRLALKKDTLTDEKFARDRFVQTLLFGDEKGEEPGQAKDFAAYLDALKPEARQEYERLLRGYYGLKSDNPLPHHSGRLIFYPTFFNLIDVEVINPHSRQTKAGTHPIYLECVPAGASGTFSLLYVPFDLIGKPEDEIRQQAAEDLQRVAEGLKAMFLTYGFSAKRSSGYGVAKDEIQGKVITKAGEKSLTRLSQLPQEVKDVAF